MAKSIMVVDDSRSIRQVVGLALRGEGYDVVEAGDGKEALEKLDGQKIDLIISDVNMPVMDGVTMLLEVKKHPKYKFTPVLMFTTEAGADMKAKGQQAGAKAWIVKPFQPDVLLSAVSKLT